MVRFRKTGRLTLISALILALLLAALPGLVLAENAAQTGQPEGVEAEPVEDVIEAPEVPLEGPGDDVAPQPTAEPQPEKVPEPEAVPEAAGEGQLTLNATALTLGRGESFTLVPTAPGEGVTYTYATSDGKVATVDGSGRVTGKKSGKTATITVASSTGLTAECAVKVAKAPSSIKLSAKSATLSYDTETGAGMQYRLGVTLSKGSASALTFADYDGSVVSVDAAGVITAVGLGSTKLTVRTFNKKKATIKLTVKSAPTGIALDSDRLYLCEGEKRKLTGKLQPDGAVASLSFTSDNPAVAAVDAASGEITALALGEATVTVTTYNGKQAAAKVSVVPGPDRIGLLEGERTLGVGEKTVVPAEPLRDDGLECPVQLQYASSKAKVASVDKDGVLTARRKGTAKITVSAPNGVKAEMTIRVVKPPKAIQLDAKKLVLEYDAEAKTGTSRRLKVSLSKGSASSVSFGGYDPAVVKVSPDGTVTAVGLGSTTVRAETYNGKSASVKVTVRPLGAPDPVYRGSHPMIVVAHRGGCGYWPENTLEAFRHSRETGADAVELDARTTKDGVEVVHHDASFTVDGKQYVISRCTLKQLQAVKPDLCTLDQALEVVSGSGMTCCWS